MSDRSDAVSKRKMPQQTLIVLLVVGKSTPATPGGIPRADVC